ncbi:MAG: hypothetical protein OXH91_01845 [Chloroflexota bacterium]|nr:hypothetical protein [Chloroflexota bacterium]
MELIDLNDSFEAYPSHRHLRNARSAIERLRDDGKAILPPGSSQLIRWIDACNALHRFIRSLGRRRNIEQQDMPTAMREFFHEFEHSEWRILEILHSLKRDRKHRQKRQAILDWMTLTYRFCTYAITSAWIDEKAETVSIYTNMKIGPNCSTVTTEKTTVEGMKVPRKYKHAKRRL